MFIGFLLSLNFLLFLLWKKNHLFFTLSFYKFFYLSTFKFFLLLFLFFLFSSTFYFSSPSTFSFKAFKQQTHQPTNIPNKEPLQMFWIHYLFWVRSGNILGCSVLWKLLEGPYLYHSDQLIQARSFKKIQDPPSQKTKRTQLHQGQTRMPFWY